MKTEIDAIMLFIAELTGSFEAGTGNKETKIKCGQRDYITKYTHELDLGTEEGCKDLHENIWLERLYEDLDAYFDIEDNKTARYLCVDEEKYREDTYKWTVPIELDSSASMLQYIGLLLNDKRLLDMTNVIGDTLEDPWKLDGMSRNMLKTAATPMLYASSQTCGELWKKAKIVYTAADTELYNKEMADGPFGLANAFKDFLVNNCSPEAEMYIKIGKDAFGISCNRFRNVGEKLKAYKIWDSIDNHYNTILHTDIKKLPDLEQFRRFFPTLLIHNIDSQVMNTITDKVMDKYGFALPIHDAAVCSPAVAADVRMWMNEELTKIHDNRKQILKDFFRSIGINASANEDWEHLQSKVVPFEGILEEELSMPLK